MSESEAPVSGPRVAAASALVCVFGLTFAALALLPVEVPVYVPLEHRWSSGFPPKPAVGMDFYGRALYALIAGALAAALAAPIAKALNWRPKPGSGAVRMLALYAFVATLLPIFIYCYTLLFK